MRVTRKVCIAAATLILTALVSSAPAFAVGEAHPFEFSFGSFSNPNGIAVDEATGDVYVADIGTDKIYKFDAEGNPVAFSSLGVNELSGAATPAGSFSFPASERDEPAAVAVDNSTSASDVSRGDLYVMDAGHDVVDKFNAAGEYLGQIAGPFTTKPKESAGQVKGVGVDASGKVYVRFMPAPGNENLPTEVDVFYDSASNPFASLLEARSGSDDPKQGMGFAVSPAGDLYVLADTCGCVEKEGQNFAPLGTMDAGSEGGGPADVAAAVDPATGHVYVDDQSSVGEWVTGEMNGSAEVRVSEEGPRFATPEGTLVTRFGEVQLSGSSGQGGIAINGASGKIYVSNPADGKVYVFGTDVPAIVTGEAPSSATSATLDGTVDPRGEAVTSCDFEYGAVNGRHAFVGGAYEHKEVACSLTAAQIGSSSAPVSVSAHIEGLTAGLLYHYRLTVANANGSSYSTGLFASAGAGFGVKKFEVAFLNQDGTPDVQAGSHPYEMTTNIEYNTHWLRQEPSVDSPYRLQPDGNFKNVIVDLPPGLVGDPEATTKRCTLTELDEAGYDDYGADCPEESEMGELDVEFGNNDGTIQEPVHNMLPPFGVADQIGANLADPNVFIDSGVLAGGDYPVRATVTNASADVPVTLTRLTVFGVPPHGQEPRTPFLTMPTGCHGPLRSTLTVNSYQEPAKWVQAESQTETGAGEPVALTGCSKLKFPPTISVTPDSTDASTSSGLAVDVHVPQNGAFNPTGLAESALRNTTVTLPEGVALNPAGGNDLEACSNGLIGFTGDQELDSEYEPGVTWSTFTPEMPSPLLPGENFCPNGSKIGTVKIRTPLLKNPLEGAVYLAVQEANPFGSLVAMYLVAEDPVSGTLIKLAGEVSLTSSGQIVTTFNNTPDLPFEELELHFFGGERAPLSTPSRCGSYTTEAVFTPWDGNGSVHTDSTFTIDHGAGGGPCPGASLPFKPTLTSGMINNQAGSFSPFTMTMSRTDGEQNLQSIGMTMPPGLMGSLVGVKLCPEAQANAGTCGPESLIGETTVSVGVGSDPYTVEGGKVYLTETYEGAPFGLSIVNPAKAGPFDLEKTAKNHPSCDCLVVRAKIEVNPLTSQLTITSDNTGPYKIPTILEGIPLQIQHINVTINRPDFMFNPTNCAKETITGTIDSAEGATESPLVPLQAANCAQLPFEPKFEAFTKAAHTRKTGAYLHVTVESSSGQADIGYARVQLPKALPSELKTLQHACTEAQFESNPAGCPAESVVGIAEVQTPVLPVPLKGPAYFVSRGAQWPELIMVLQGYGVTVQLHGETFISKAGVTSTTLGSVPDVPFTRFSLTLPQKEYSALAGNGDLCAKQLVMPVRFIGQNGKTLEQNTEVQVQGCPTALKVASRKVHKRTVTLKVYVPAAGTLQASGKGLSASTMKPTGRKTVTIKLHQKHAGNLKSEVRLSFTPSAGKRRKRQVKSLPVKFKAQEHAGTHHHRNGGK